MEAHPRITLIITTYNWPAALDLTLRSVARQTAAPVEISPSQIEGDERDRR
jgi:glycosyltransferase involved in cell wall biosynthesis